MNIIAQCFQTKLQNLKLQITNVHKVLLFKKLTAHSFSPIDAAHPDNEALVLIVTDGFDFIIGPKEFAESSPQHIL